MDDAAAIEKVLNGENEAFRHLVEKYQKQAVAHSTAIFGNREDALDATQEAFIDAFKSLKNFDQTRKFYPWFYVLLRNRCYKMTAKKRVNENIEETEILAPTTDFPVEDRLTLEKALLSLSKEDREIVTLKYLDGFSYDELAEYLQIPKGTVMSRLFYARRQMQTKIEGKFRRNEEI